MTDTINPDDKAAPSDETGIDITKLRIGTTILVETEDERLFELTVKKPDSGVIEVSGTEPRLKLPTLGVLTHSFDEKTSINFWIGKYLKMMLVFRNGNYESKLVTHASLRGEDWQYEVF